MQGEDNKQGRATQSVSKPAHEGSFHPGCSYGTHEYSNYETTLPIFSPSTPVSVYLSVCKKDVSGWQLFMGDFNQQSFGENWI